MLRERGFEPTGHVLVGTSQTLSDDLTKPETPAGVTVRPVRIPEEIDARVRVHQQSFGSSLVLGVREYQRLRETPHYRNDFDLVAVTSDGRFAAAAIVWLDAANGIGLFEPVGTDPGYRGRGIGRALLAEGLRRLRDAGVRLAKVNFAESNAASRALYLSCGFRRDFRRVEFAVREGPEARNSRDAMDRASALPQGEATPPTRD